MFPFQESHNFIPESANLEPEDVTFLNQPMTKQALTEAAETGQTSSEPDSDARKTPEIKVEIRGMSPEAPQEQNGEGMIVPRFHTNTHTYMYTHIHVQTYPRRNVHTRMHTYFAYVYAHFQLTHMYM